MRASFINKLPADWLKEIGEEPPKIKEVLASFVAGATLKACLYQADHLFLRFHGPKSSRPIYKPNYWVDGSVLADALARASQFEGFLTDQEITRVAKAYYRELPAICQNWNPLKDTELWKIQLRGGETLEGLAGPIAAQPTFAATSSDPATTSILHGGGIQVYLDPKTPFVCTPVNWGAVA
jgi:hypothetical protein